MHTTLSIWNMALGFIGTRTVASEHEHTQEAVQCRLFWDTARRQVLRDFPWNFAQRRAWLARVETPEGFEGQHAFVLPQDCLKVHSILPSADSSPIAYTLAYDMHAARTVVVCALPVALLVYSADVVQTGLFDDLCAHMLARKLATCIAVPLLKNNTHKVQELETLYRQALPRALEANASEVPFAAHAALCDAWIASREGGHA